MTLKVFSSITSNKEKINMKHAEILSTIMPSKEITNEDTVLPHALKNNKKSFYIIFLIILF